MQTVTDYIVIESANIDALVERVNLLIEGQDFQPLGGVTRGKGNNVMQALVKYEPEA